MKKIKRFFAYWWYRIHYNDGSYFCERDHGRFYVLYPDGTRSRLMLYRNAANYADIFGGTVHFSYDEEVKAR